MLPKISNLFVAYLLLFLVQSFVTHSRNLKSGDNYLKLQDLEGNTIQKGQTVEGLHGIKRYLKKYGFYSENVVELNDQFDDSLELALRKYQKYYNLQVTGTLDSDTIKIIMTPRCGNSDVTSEKRHGQDEHHHHHESEFFHIVSHYSFFGGTPKWLPSKYHLKYAFSNTGNRDKIEMSAVFAEAFRKWSSVTQFTFEEAKNGEPADIHIGFFRWNHGDGTPFDGTGGVLAHAFAPADGRLHYDGDEKWSTNPKKNEFDLQSIATHEIGHVLGLGHSKDTKAIMYAFFNPGVIKRDLAQDDIDGIRKLYS